MNLVLGGLGTLILGALAALALVRSPRVALVLAMGAIVLACALFLAAAVSVLATAAPGVTEEVAWPLPLGAARLAVDGLSAWFLMTIAVVSACVAVYAPSYMITPESSPRMAMFGALLCTLVAALVVVVTAADAVLFLVAWEGMTLTAFFLISFDHDRAEVRSSAWMYLVATHIGTALCVVPLFSVLTAWSGATTFAGFAPALAPVGPVALFVLFLLALGGFGTKAGFLPMHIWLPAAHPVAPTPVSALLSGVMVKMGIYAIFRLLTWMPPLPAACGYLLLAVGVSSGVMGVLYALGQHNLKRLLAYHTIENIGIIAIGMAVGMLGQTAGLPAVAALGYTGALLHVTNHALFKGLLFLSAGAVLHGTGTVDIERLGGLARRAPANALLFLVGAVAISGLPPLNGFVSEWVIYQALFGSSMQGLGAFGGASAMGILALALMGGLALACFAKVMGVVFLGVPRDRTLSLHAVPPPMLLSMSLIAVCCVLIGLLPAGWLPLTTAAVAPLLHLSTNELHAATAPAVASASNISLLALVLAGVFCGLLLVRWRLAAPAPAAVGTWGCAYPLPTARMQYTSTAFALPLIGAFRTLLWPERHLDAPAGTFPGPSRVASHLPDFAENDFFRPVFRRIDRGLAMIRTISLSGKPQERAALRRRVRPRPLRAMLEGMIAALRRGAIQVCLLFIVITLVFLFLVEGLSAPGAGIPVRGDAPRPSPSAEVIP